MNPRTYLGFTAGAVCLACLISPAQAIPVVTVQVNGTSYEVTYFQGSYNGSAASFETPTNNGLMPWWGNASLATQFSDALGSQLDKPNGNGIAGPFFAYQTYDTGEGIVVEAFAYFASTESAGGSTVGTFSYATATPSPSAAVPGPVPLFGAAAAFGASRRLRRRIELSA
jgi:hypothetical protein